MGSIASVASSQNQLGKLLASGFKILPLVGDMKRTSPHFKRIWENHRLQSQNILFPAQQKLIQRKLCSYTINHRHKTGINLNTYVQTSRYADQVTQTPSKILSELRLELSAPKNCNALLNSLLQSQEIYERSCVILRKQSSSSFLKSFTLVYTYCVKTVQ